MLVHSICIGTVAAIATWLSFPLAARMSGDCGTVEDLKIEDTNLPEYCRVLGYGRPAINFEIRLPTKDLNGKLSCLLVASAKSCP